jgi:hypothetical protein
LLLLKRLRMLKLKQSLWLYWAMGWKVSLTKKTAEIVELDILL